MPNFDQYIADINKAKNTAATRDAFRDLIRWYGDALREYIERNTALAPKPSKSTIPKTEEKKGEATIQKIIDAGWHIGIPAGKTDFIDRLAAKEDGLAYKEKAGGDSSKAASDGDEASEDYVNAAVSYYRSALCYAASSELGGAAPDYGSVSVQANAQSYAQALISAGQVLKDAYDNEAPTDYSEIIAESMIAGLMFAEAKRALVELTDKSNAKGQKVDTQADQAKADAGKTAAETKLGTFVK